MMSKKKKELLDNFNKFLRDNDTSFTIPKRNEEFKCFVCDKKKRGFYYFLNNDKIEKCCKNCKELNS